MGTLSLSAASITYLTVSIFKVLIAATPNLFSVAYVKISFTFALKRILYIKLQLAM